MAKKSAMFLHLNAITLIKLKKQTFLNVVICGPAIYLEGIVLKFANNLIIRNSLNSNLKIKKKNLENRKTKKIK